MDLDIRFKKLRIDAVVPAYAHGSGEDAGLDLAYWRTIPPLLLRLTGILDLNLTAVSKCGAGH